MKKQLAMTLIAGLVATGGLASASSQATQETAVEQAAAAAQSSMDTMQQSFSGLVKKTEQGLMLETQSGDYLLKGLSLEEIIGKEVYVTGVVRSDSEANTIYVVKADVKE